MVYIGGLMYFAVLPTIKEGTWQKALLNGELIGTLCYATYDLANWATLKDWLWQIVLVDIAWGAFITTIAATVGYFVGMAVK